VKKEIREDVLRMFGLNAAGKKSDQAETEVALRPQVLVDLDSVMGVCGVR
jgi:hypothetical protein